jgi:hypothetical protein
VSGISPGKGHVDDRPPRPPFGEPERIQGKRKQYSIEPLFDEKGASKIVMRPSDPEDDKNKSGGEDDSTPDTGGHSPARGSNDDDSEKPSRIAISDIVKTADDALRRGDISAADFQLIKEYFEQFERLR